MRQVLTTPTGITVMDVPEPALLPGGILVRVTMSCISTGTELSGVRGAGMPLWRRALRNPERAVEAVRNLADLGLKQAAHELQVRQRLGKPMGYSASGTVIAVGTGVDEFAIGDHVACAGAGVANHAEVISVPRNLAVHIPPGVEDAQASTVALGAIALQGIRRAEPTLGETFVVVGLGIIGQLTVQLLAASGASTVVIDPRKERVELARRTGADLGDVVAGELEERVLRLTGGVGADGVIVTASSSSNDIVALAFHLCRKKGRVVVVGDVGLGLEREDLYAKELELRMSTSYGPGRYDGRFEEAGLDYPVEYVRWTETRNMSAYLEAVARGSVNVVPLIAETYPVERAPDAYRLLGEGDPPPLLVLLSYGGERHSGTKPPRAVGTALRSGTIRLALVGAGSFARDVHVPNLMRLRQRFEVGAVVARSGPSALAVANHFSARASTELSEVLSDESVDAVLISTRHDLHASQVVAALEAGKHVFVEKPLAVDQRGLGQIEATVERLGKDCPVLMTGYNRRFAPAAQVLRSWLAERAGPVVMSYRVNAGRLPVDHWLLGPEGGGRNLGEACHMYDLFRFLVGLPRRGIQAAAAGDPNRGHRVTDNFAATLTYDDGSLASLVYTALGAPAHPKEKLTIFSDGQVAELQDWKLLTTTRGEGLTSRTIEKGHLEELEAFANAISLRGSWPIPFDQQIEVAQTALEVEDVLTGTEAKI